MPDSSAEDPRPDAPLLVSIPEMPPNLAAAGMKTLTPARIRQLVTEDEGFPKTVYERGRVRLWLWADVLRYFRDRKLKPGERTDLKLKDSAARPGV